MPNAEASSNRRPNQGERWGLLLILIGFLAVTLSVGSRTPPVWSDEVFMSDPAVNKLLGHGFTSSSSALGTSETWVGNAPLHVWLLYPWVRCWGISILSVRSINYVYTAAALFLVWATVLRSGLIKDSMGRLLLVVILACQYDLTFAYCCARYDCLGMLVTVGIAAAFTLTEAKWRISLLFALGFLLPFSGLQLLPVVVAAGVLAFFFGELRRLLPAAIGGIAGGLFMVGLFKFLGLWQGFQTMIHSTAGIDTNPLWKRLLHVLNPFFGSDSSLCLSALALLFALIFCYLQRIPWARNRPLAAVVILTWMVPFVMAIAGHFPIYYHWMVTVPLVIATVSLLSLLRVYRHPGRWLIFFLLALSAMIGLPARVAVTVREWSQRDYAPLEAFVRAHVAPGENVGAAYSTFYAMHEVGTHAFYESHLSTMSAAEKRSIVALCIDPRTFDLFEHALGGSWIKEASYDAKDPERQKEATLYRLDFYRKK